LDTDAIYGESIMAELETFISLEDAAYKYDLPTSLLTDLVEQEEIRAIQVNDSIAVAEDEMFGLVSARTGDRKRYAPLEGNPIRLTRAAEKYRLSKSALSCWVKRGYIRVVERGPKLLLLNEADVAKAKDLADHLGMRRGHSVIRGPVYVA
jgi:hypothetical protein